VQLHWDASKAHIIQQCDSGNRSRLREGRDDIQDAIELWPASWPIHLTNSHGYILHRRKESLTALSYASFSYFSLILLLLSTRFPVTAYIQGPKGPVRTEVSVNPFGSALVAGSSLLKSHQVLPYTHIKVEDQFTYDSNSASFASDRQWLRELIAKGWVLLQEPVRCRLSSRRTVPGQW